MKNNHNDRVFNFLFSAIIILQLIFVGCSETKKEGKKQERSVPVITGEVSKRRVEYILNQVGTLEANQEITIRAEIEERVIKILFAEGTEVRAGDILVRLDAAKIQAEIKNLDASIDKLQIRLANKKRTLERKRPLVEQDLVSHLQFDDLQTEIKEIASEIVQARAALTRQKEGISDTIIRAPFDGIVGARHFSVGHYFKVGDPVVSVTALDPLQINFQVPEKYKARLSIGQEAMLRVATYPERTFRGEIFFIAPSTDLKTRSFQVKARVENTRRLLNPGMFAQVEIITEVHDHALTVPWESIIQTENETYIYIVEGGVARKLPVHLGKVASEWAEVLDAGIPAGTAVILEGKFAAKDGMKVNIK